MSGIMQTIRDLFAHEAGKTTARSDELRAPKRQSASFRSSPTLKAMEQLVGDQMQETAGEDVFFDEILEVAGKRTSVQLHSDNLLLREEDTDISRVIRMDDSLDHYHGLDFELRMQLGQRIARLLPDLEHHKHEKLLNHTAKTLKTIAQDQSDRVRMMLAEELADLPNAPLEVVKALAWDTCPQVAFPILEYSPLLSDRELIEIISTSNLQGVDEAIAKRQGISSAVSHAIVDRGQPRAIGILLENQSAQIDESDLQQIITLAPQHESWHSGLIARPELTQKTIARISGFIAQELLMKLEDNQHITRKHKRHSRAAVNHRLNSWSEEQMRQAELQVRQLHAAGKLDDELIDTAINTPNEAFAVAALAARTLMSCDKVKRIIRSESPRAITALAWEAGLPMRSALALQIKIGRIHHTKLVNARGGTDYPLSEDEMQTYLELFS